MPNTQVVVDVYMYNDEHLGAFTIPLVYPDTNSTLPLICDSVSVVGHEHSATTAIFNPIHFQLTMLNTE